MSEQNWIGGFLIIIVILTIVAMTISGVNEYRDAQMELDFCVQHNYTRYHSGTAFEWEHYCSRIVDGKIEKYYLGGCNMSGFVNGFVYTFFVLTLFFGLVDF